MTLHEYKTTNKILTTFFNFYLSNIKQDGEEEEKEEEEGRNKQIIK